MPGGGLNSRQKHHHKNARLEGKYKKVIFEGETSMKAL